MTKHAASTARRLPRKTLVAIVAASLVAVGGVAWAIYLITAGVSGSVSTSSASVAWVTSVAPAGTGTAGTTCNAAIVDSGPVLGNTLGLTVSGYPGDECTVTANLISSGSETSRVTGVALTGLPTGWKAEVVNGTCGKEITPNNPGVPVSLKITVGPSGSGSLGGGLSLSPKSQTGGATSNVGACAIQTGA